MKFSEETVKRDVWFTFRPSVCCLRKAREQSPNSTVLTPPATSQQLYQINSRGLRMDEKAIQFKYPSVTSRGAAHLHERMFKMVPGFGLVDW